MEQAQNSLGMTHIRPGQLLAIPDEFGEEIKFFMPPAQGAGGLTTLESVMLVKLLRCVQPEKVFEFGTYKGYTTRLLLENLPERATPAERIYTLDLPDLDNVVFQGDDGKLAATALNFQRKYLSSARRPWVKQIFQDSMAFDPAEYSKQFQYIFIDANHELNYVRRDTENSLVMMGGSPSCIVWHDYGNPQFPELTAYLDELAKTKPLYHIQHTMLVFHLQGVDVPPQPH